jgi:hypothetical protein
VLVVLPSCPSDAAIAIANSRSNWRSSSLAPSPTGRWLLREEGCERLVEATGALSSSESESSTRTSMGRFAITGESVRGVERVVGSGSEMGRCLKLC